MDDFSNLDENGYCFVYGVFKGGRLDKYRDEFLTFIENWELQHMILCCVPRGRLLPLIDGISEVRGGGDGPEGPTPCWLNKKK